MDTKNNENQSNYGLICVDDNNEKITTEIKRIIIDFIKWGSMYMNSRYIIEDPFFVDSAMRNLIQVSDFVAWVTKWWFFKDERYNEFIDILFENIKERFDNIRGDIEGIGIKIHP